MSIPADRYQDLRQHDCRWVDLRSPAEYERDHVPGADHAALFDDDQRAIVGTLYRKDSPLAAYEAGLEMVRQRLPRLLQEWTGQEVAESLWRPRFDALCSELAPTSPSHVELATDVPLPDQGRILVVYCWRGGMRSRSVAALLQSLGIPVRLLEGGYKSYRSWVMQRLKEEWPFPLTVLRGPTGVGKTAILAQLEEAAPGSTLCLESLAQHRSSILGAVGRRPVGQAFFESQLVDWMDRPHPATVFVEGESRKVGDIVLPEPLWQAMEGGRQVLLRARVETRVRNLMEDYLEDGDEAIEQLCQQLPFLEKRIGKSWVGQLTTWLREGRAAEVAEVLLERYYDPRYAHGDAGREWIAELEVEDAGLIPALVNLLPSSDSADSLESGRIRPQ